jgi:hypothetical protein
MKFDEMLDCPKCHLRWTPARCDDIFTLPDGSARWLPGDHIRCVECKETYLRPCQTNKNIIEEGSAAHKDELKKTQNPYQGFDIDHYRLWEFGWDRSKQSDGNLPLKTYK